VSEQRPAQDILDNLNPGQLATALLDDAIEFSKQSAKCDSDEGCNLIVLCDDQSCHSRLRPIEPAVE
jgi:hypothetical protein